jgi:PPOX class probable F420-dependent enzyme
MIIETHSEFGQRVARRLAEERIGWLTTVNSKGMPQPRPIWFLWDGETFLIYSRANAYKIRHIEAHPQVSLNLDGDGLGGDIIIFTGEAWLDEDAPPANEISAYVEKYKDGMKRINMTPEQFAEVYPIAIRIKPLKVRGH